ncbi:tRNA (adenine(22)-N(1))-methyltransferase [Paenibacillus glycanilyticus]|uniref:tRNA (Adenine(22)-N(1))-methyltransferase n=1 Tax=Paenibacillus glycanilyticus TaxID=126569 RepID=A0ABQ6NK94_9BACL|nr:class I SAM-dependent methyltransferase [Paenibacillus glycanilyticus]GMK45526.1 tRNA (adenine(22)-N(1))-methyltransferase [Paenibacillus glycanilyticus]
MLKLSRRLQRIADFVTPGSRVADIGSDHALLPVYLIQSGRVPSAIAGELNPGPFEAARKQAVDAGLTGKLQVRRGDGLSVLQPGETDTVTIAGMGGSLMSSILEEGYLAGKLDGVKELILQPNVGEEFVRGWLLKRGWFLAEESILEEDDKIYEVLHAFKYDEAESRKRNSEVYDPSFLALPAYQEKGAAILERMGPHLLRAPQDVFFKKWRLELDKLGKIVAQMSQSDLEQAEQKKQQFREEMNVIEEVLQCLQTGRPSSN